LYEFSLNIATLSVLVSQYFKYEHIEQICCWLTN